MPRMQNTRWTLVVVIVGLLFGVAFWGWGALPQQLKAARMTNATLAVNIDDEVGNLEKALGDILGIPMDTNITAALFTATSAGLTKVKFQDLAGDPAASGELARNGTALKYHNGTSALTVASTADITTHSNMTTGIHGATDANTASRIVQRDASGNFSATTIGADLIGNVTGNASTATHLSANGGNCTAGNAPLGVDDFGAVESCFDVATQTELDTHVNATAVHGAVSTNTPSRIVTRDANGDFAANVITANQFAGVIVGNAETATALAANGANCSTGEAPLGVSATGVAESCFDVATQGELDTHTGATTAHSATSTNTASRIVLRDASGNFAAGTITASLSGNATTATTASAANALAADGSDCPAGSAPRGIDTAGNATNCFTVTTPTSTETVSGKSIDGASNTLTNIPSTALKTATGESTFADDTSIGMSAMMFFPNFEQHTCNQTITAASLTLVPSNQADDFVGRIGILGIPTCGTGTYRVAWRYLTSSRDPEIVVLRDKNTGEIKGIWRAEIDSGNSMPIASLSDPDNLETVYVADFPNAMKTEALDTVMTKLNDNTYQAGTIQRTGTSKTALQDTARSKGRVVIDALPTLSVQ